MKLLNFSIDQGIYLHIAGQIFDLHNAFTLENYSYDVRKRAFTLDLKGKVYWNEAAFTNEITIDLNLIFDQVNFVRLQETPAATDERLRAIDPTSSFKYLEARLASIQTIDEIVGQAQWPIVEVEGLFRTDEIAEEDWHNYLVIDFHFGASILISAETVKTFFYQRNTEDA
ncbi:MULTISPECIES: hypothetical protein [Cyanophyceae]|uniref:hypothetical protein n=1 Tax=Cyanophyceae TaxID=3028117 RepID=UPI001684ACB5|nr:MULTISPECIES: hypothetical protein [Cyanophyceae]MBD1918097.1 hypothetical protein [Phormidium sp. FACHB-77]MBD2030129.1 hypothetical protein [Phormidium sp. FACHB-322]MBD2051499.1 hypothetical protein [Leptolyngbya sp. FACHB-60]